MSEEDKSFTSVLLPAARVALFTTDAGIKAEFQTLSGDWRFARVGLEAHDGDVETATAYYAGQTPPDLVIIQTETIDDGFSERLEALSEHMSEKTAAIVIGPVNDVNLYRKLVSMGVSDYLVKPVSAAMLANDIAETLIEQLGVADSRLIGVMGAKGGVGATILTEALAWGISGVLAQKTFLLDAAGGWSTLSVGVNFEPTTTLAEAVRAATEQNEDSLTRMIHQAGEKLFVLTSGGDVMLDDSVDPQGYEVLLEYLMGLYPVVLVDLSAATAGLKRAVLSRAHQILLVTAPVLPSVRAARTLLHEIKELRGGDASNVDVILNMHGYAPKHEVPRKQIQEGLGSAPAAVVPFAPELFVATESDSGLLSKDKAGEEILRNLLKTVEKPLSATVAEADGDDGRGGGLSRILTKLKTKG